MRDQLTLAMKWEDGADNVGSVAYEYCLTCDSAMSRRFVYAGGSGSTQGEILQGQRFVYDGITLLRVDQLYDSDEDEELEMTDAWRVWWENTTMPALLGGLLAKRVYSYPNDQSGTSNGSTDFYYAHDAIGNVIAVSDGAGARQHHFTQDAFGNELTLDSLGGDDWNAAHEDGIWEHQTGKWFDPETGLYFFHARWVDPVVGRFVGRTVLPRHAEGAYVYCENNTISSYDPDGLVTYSSGFPRAPFDRCTLWPKFNLNFFNLPPPSPTPTPIPPHIVKLMEDMMNGNVGDAVCQDLSNRYGNGYAFLFALAYAGASNPNLFYYGFWHWVYGPNLFSPNPYYGPGLGGRDPSVTPTPIYPYPTPCPACTATPCATPVIAY